MLVNSDEIMDQLIDEIPTMSEAIRCSIRCAKLTDKQVYLELGIDGGQWTRIMSSQAHFPHEKFIELMSICGNDIPLAWLAKKRGYEIRLLKTTFEDLLQKEKSEKEKLQIQLDSILDILKKANFPTG